MRIKEPKNQRCSRVFAISQDVCACINVLIFFDRRFRLDWPDRRQVGMCLAGALSLPDTQKSPSPGGIKGRLVPPLPLRPGGCSRLRRPRPPQRLPPTLSRSAPCGRFPAKPLGPVIGHGSRWSPEAAWKARRGRKGSKGMRAQPALAGGPLRPLEAVHLMPGFRDRERSEASTRPEPLPRGERESEGNPSHTCIDRRPEAPTLPYMTLRGPCRAPLKTCFCRSL